MEISVTDAKAQLTELVRLAEAGEEVVLTRHGRPTVRLAPVKKRRTRQEILTAVDEISRSASSKATPGPSAARSQDFLYDENGLPK